MTQQTLRRIGAGLLDLVFPPHCLACGHLAERFCDECRAAIQPVTEGVPVPEGLRGVHSVGYHEGPLRQAVLRLKFAHKTALARPLGELLAEELAAMMESWQPDMLVPVPIHWTRDWERGFNQSELLAQEISRHSHLSMRGALRRTRRTRPQVDLTGDERAENLRGAFAVDRRHPVENAWIVLVDDVHTTGATLSECAAILRAAGAAEVFGLTVTYDR